MRFNTDGLLSKWGFSDGDVLSDLLYDNNLGGVDEHAVLQKVVTDHIVPNLKQNIELEFIHTIHNPMRASTVNGKSVDWYNLDTSNIITPETVIVEDSVILDIARKIS